jgi:very-short-patch-repair endonuclease
LRNDATKAERLLWWQLRGKELDGLKFRRQYGVGEYVIDLYCPGAKLAIEVDGENHYEPRAELLDAKRQAFIESFGIRVLRFTNPQVYDDLDGVIEEIWRIATERALLLKTPLNPPLVRGEATVPSVVRGEALAPLLDKEGVGGGQITNAPRKVTHNDPPVSPLIKGGGFRPPLVPPCKVQARPPSVPPYKGGRR